MMEKNKSISTETVIWVILISATVLSYSLVESVNVARIAVSIALLIGAFKARMIVIYFMGLKREMLPHRIIYEAWTVLALIVILGGYWYTQLMR